MLRIVYKVFKSSFSELFSEGNLFTVHHRNVQKLAIKMSKVKSKLCSEIMLDLFTEQK